MNYDLHMTQLIDALSADKSIPPQYRNAVASSARRLQLEIRGARTMTVLQPQETESALRSNTEYVFGKDASAVVCTCPVGGRKRDCAVHGDGV